MGSDLILDYGPRAAVVLWLVQQIWRRVSAWQDRKWRKEDASEDKVFQLYERFIQQQRNTLGIMDRNSDEMSQMRAAFEKELPELISSVRDLIERVARLEKRLEQ